MRAFLLVLLITTSVSAEFVHTIAPGETLSSIARKYFGAASAWQKIARDNNITDPNRVRIGQKIRIDAAIAPAVPVSPPPPAPPDFLDVSSRAAIDQELVLISSLGPVTRVRSITSAILKSGDKIFPGDALRTSAGGRALLAGRGGERIDLGAQTAVVLHELSATASDRRLLLRVDRGLLEFRAPAGDISDIELARYLFETPTGSVSARGGHFSVSVDPPQSTSVSVFSGNVSVSVPHGQCELAAGHGGMFRTLEPPKSPAPLPGLPGISIETSEGLAIVAAATRPSHTVRIGVFDDRDMQKQTRTRLVIPDDLGVALTRIDLPAGEHWIKTEVISPEGLVSPAVVSGPITIAAASPAH